MFFSVAKHNLTVVGIDGSYTKPLTTDYITIAAGQSMDALLHANQNPDHYYMAASPFSSSPTIPFDKTTTTAIVQYNGNYAPSTTLSMPQLPYYNDSNAAFGFLGSLRSLAGENHPAHVPTNITTQIISTLSINALPCPGNRSCEGPNGTVLAASVSGITFENPSIGILEAYYKRIHGVYGTNFPNVSPLIFNFTADDLPSILEISRKGTEVKVLPYNATVEIVFQGSNSIAGLYHPMHLHGNSFYIVGWGYGSFDKGKDPQNYNLIDPPFRNTVTLPRNGWTTIRFQANNPGN